MLSGFPSRRRLPMFGRYFITKEIYSYGIFKTVRYCLLAWELNPYVMKKKILVIDDEEDFCELIKNILSRENFLVDCAFTLEEAEGKLRDHPQIILLDINLPDGSGLDYLQMHPAPFMYSSVIVITADPTESVKEKAAQEGTVAFLSKPFSVQTIRDMVRQVA
jgi:DNA-binding NtrC family response regulator